jgi:hypothetical protein
MPTARATDSATHPNMNFSYLGKIFFCRLVRFGSFFFYRCVKNLNKQNDTIFESIGRRNGPVHQNCDALVIDSLREKQNLWSFYGNLYDHKQVIIVMYVAVRRRHSVFEADVVIVHNAQTKINKNKNKL